MALRPRNAAKKKGQAQGGGNVRSVKVPVVAQQQTHSGQNSVASFVAGGSASDAEETQGQGRPNGSFLTTTVRFRNA